MSERLLSEEVENMCRGCFWQNESGHCKLVNVTNELQLKKTKENSCEESMSLSWDLNMFPLVETSLVPTTRFKMATGVWAIQVGA